MTIFRQLGDPVGVGVCLCQHHGAAYAEQFGIDVSSSQSMRYRAIDVGATIVQVSITITERCCIVVNAAMVAWAVHNAVNCEIERPIGTPRTQQRDDIQSNVYDLTHHAAWEVLDPGIYTYFLVNRTVASLNIYAAWIKAVASDCEG
jgi:hypothetical protein